MQDSKNQNFIKAKKGPFYSKVLENEEISQGIYKLKIENTSNVQSALLIGDPFFDNQSNLVAKERGIIDEIDFASRNMEHLRLEYSEDEILSIGSLISDEKIYLSKNATETIFKIDICRFESLLIRARNGNTKFIKRLI